jgi:hypothetical protein
MKSARFVATVAAASIAGAATAQVFVEGVNNELPVDPTWTATGGHEQAFRWTPQNSFDLAQILWHSSAISNGTIRLREDTGTTPGEILREVDFSSGSSGWNGAAFAEPYPVTAGETYFVSFWAALDYKEFQAQSGPGETILTYYWTPDVGRTWNGPYTFAGRRMIEFYAPEAGGCYADCDESGGLDFFDFLCFQNSFAAGEKYADCDASGALDFFDFLCFQNEFVAGCP